jgi:hypothetical protein
LADLCGTPLYAAPEVTPWFYSGDRTLTLTLTHNPSPSPSPRPSPNHNPSPSPSRSTLRPR